MKEDFLASLYKETKNTEYFIFRLIASLLDIPCIMHYVFHYIRHYI